MSVAIVVSIANTSDSLFQAEVLPAIEKVAKSIVNMLSQVGPTAPILISSLTTECLQTAVKISKKTGFEVLYSFNLSNYKFEVEEGPVDPPDLYPGFSSDPECDMDNAFYRKHLSDLGILPGNSIDVCKYRQDPERLFEHLQSMNFDFQVLIVDAKLEENLSFAPNCVLDMNPFKVYSSLKGDFMMTIESVSSEEEEIDPGVEGILAQLEPDVKRILEQLDKFDLQDPSLLSSAVAEVQRILQESQEIIRNLHASFLEQQVLNNVNQILGQIQQECANSFQSMKQLAEYISRLSALIKRKLPMEEEHVVNGITVQRFYYSENKGGWSVKIENTTDFHIRNISIELVESKKEVMRFRAVEPKTLVKKTNTELNYDPDTFYYKHLIARQNGKPISIAYVVNPVHFVTIYDNDDGSFECIFKNKSRIQFQSLGLCSNSRPEPITSISKVPSAGQEFGVTIADALSTYSGQSLFLTDYGEIISNSIELKIDN